MDFRRSPNFRRKNCKFPNPGPNRSLFYAEYKTGHESYLYLAWKWPERFQFWRFCRYSHFQGSKCVYISLALNGLSTSKKWWKMFDFHIYVTNAWKNTEKMSDFQIHVTIALKEVRRYVFHVTNARKKVKEIGKTILCLWF